MTSPTSSQMALWRPGGPVVVLEPGDPQPAASLLKPFYAWQSRCNERDWDDLAHAAITRSDNDATDSLGTSDLPGMLERIGFATGVSWDAAVTWGQVRIDAGSVLHAYRAMVEDDSARAQQVREMMRQVEPAQRLGFELWEELSGQQDLAYKCGWDLTHDETGIVTHGVVLGARSSVAVLTMTPVRPAEASLWRETVRGGPEAVLPLHRQWAGAAIEEALRSASEHLDD